MTTRMFYALSTVNYQENGYSVLAQGSDKETVRNQAEAKISKNYDGIYAETMYRNLIIAGKTEAKKYGVRI